MTIARTGESRPATWLGASWARARIRDLEDRYAAGARELEPEIVKVSTQFGVLSRFTAYLAIDRSQIANAGGRLHQVVQAVDEPAGWDRGAAPGGAYSATLANALGAGGMMAGASGAGAPMAPSPMPAMRAAPMRTMMQGRAEAKSHARGSSMQAPPSPPMGVQLSKAKREDDARVEPAAYLAKLAELARELEAKIGTPAIRLVRQRLVEWIEDVRSVGTDDTLATAVEQLVTRLSAALATSRDTEIREIAAELARLATGATPPAPGRVAFWK